MDIEAFESVLRRLERGDIRVVARDLTEPSPLALEALNARPYAYLDDAPLEERRTQAVMSRRWLDPESAADLGKLDPEAIARVRAEAWPDATTPDELHDALLWLTFMSEAECGREAAWPPMMQDLAGQGRAVSIRRPQCGALWVAAERRALFEPPPSSDEASPNEVSSDESPSDESLVTIVRGRLEGLGPVGAAALAASVGVPELRLHSALAVLEAEGFAMRGRYTAGASDASAEEWCERRLLARIHRYTVKRLRAEIEPVPARDFIRFLCDWQRVSPESRMQGSDAVAAVLAQLEGFEAPAGAWETEILPSRIAEYEPLWLDDHCRAGRFIWTRLAPRGASRDAEPDRVRAVSPVRSTPIVLLARRTAADWSALVDPPDAAHLTSRAQAVADYIRAHGASFFDEIAEHVGMLPVEAEEALGELVATGLVNSDSFAGLRALLAPSGRRGKSSAFSIRHRRRLALFEMSDAGRWALVRRAGRAGAPEGGEGSVEQIVRTLLRRWGVIFWKLLTREAGWLPPWRDILKCCRRLEARGEIRGGRFVAGFSGEQFATPEAVGSLRDVRRKPHTQQQISLSAADPLNVIGILTPGARLASLAGNRLLLRDGLPVAIFAGGEVQYLEDLAATEQWAAKTALLRRHAPASLDDLALIQ